MDFSKRFISTVQRHNWVIEHQADGLTEEDMLLQLPFRGNCFNWVLGHMAVNRDKILTTLQVEAFFDEDVISLYDAGSEPIVGGETAVSSTTFLQFFTKSAEKLTQTIPQLSEAAYNAIYDDKRQTTVGDRIEFLLWHEAYHVGQLEYLRQLAGKDDAVI